MSTVCRDSYKDPRLLYRPNHRHRKSLVDTSSSTIKDNAFDRSMRVGSRGPVAQA